MGEKALWKTQGTREGRHTGINNAEGFRSEERRVG